MRATATALALGAVLAGSALLAGCSGTAPSSATESTSVAASAASAIPAGAFDPVLTLVVERLATGDAVAASKYFSGQPVVDAAREKAVLDAAAARAVEVGADQSVVATVFADQITASKQVQQALLDAWASGTASPPSAAPDLATEVRPVLDRITASLVAALAAVEPFRADPGCPAAVAEAAAATASAATTASPQALAALPTATAHLCDSSFSR